VIRYSWCCSGRATNVTFIRNQPHFFDHKQKLCDVTKELSDQREELSLHMDRKEVYTACVKLVDERIAELESTLQELAQSIEGESKSSAGDKHETTRAVLHLEQEKTSLQLEELLHQRSALQQNEHADHDTLHNGSLILTDKGYIYLSVGLGKVKVRDTEVMVISPASPLGQLLNKKKKGDRITIHDNTFTILEIE
jgi:hypothetical protein